MNKLLILSLIFCICNCSFSVNAQTSSFTFQSSNGLFCSPTTINFTQTCSGNPIGFSWNFGNGQVSNAANPSVTYTIPGNYEVKLVAIFNDQAIESSQTITINPSITGSLSADRNYICTPGNIAFTASSSGTISSYEWNFGDGSPTISTTTPTINHPYTAFGNFTASVKATDALGCFVNSTTNISVQSPPITGAVSPMNGCIPANVNFTTNVSVPLNSNVTSVVYNYGDGSPTSTAASHNYTMVGSYTASVVITTSEGCTNTYNYPGIAFGTPPTAHIAYPKKNVYCGSETAIFVSKAVNANSWVWNYGDGITQTVNDTVTTHKYDSLGVKTITVTPYFNGCAGSPISFSINVVGVIAGFNYSNTCSNKKSFSFTNTSQGNVSTSLWNFGDGSPNSSLSNVTHAYPASGAFLTTLTVTDNISGCIDVFSATIYTAAPTLLNPSFSICRNSSTTFTIQNNYSNNAASYNWSVIGLPSSFNSNNPYTITASMFGNFSNNQVIIYNGTQYCNDTITANSSILVRGPNLSFNASLIVCAKNNYNILNTSTGFVPADTINFSYWNYGMSTKNDTIFQPPTIKYASAGIYNIKLVVKDNKGCIDSLSQQVDVKPIPFLRIFPRNDTLCQGKSATIIAYHSDILSWSPTASLSCANCDTTIASPTTTTLYYATVNNSFNCPSIDSTLITVFEPFTATALSNPVYVCLMDSVTIGALPTGKKIFWSPSTNISNTTIYNPVVSPPTNTTYTAVLTDSVGCFSATTSVDLIIKSLPTVKAGPDKILPYNSMFTISPVYSSNVVSYLWSPSNLLVCNTCPTANGTALTSLQYTIKATSDSGCVSKDAINVFVECKFANLLMPSAFTPNRDGLNDLYYPLTRGIKTIKRFAIYNRFGQQVYEAKGFLPNDKSFGWNGKFKGEDQIADTYIYMLETICDLGETIVKKDSFLLLR